MKPQHVPTLGPKYWTALVLASIFGANTGDFMADALHLGHWAGLPVLALLFGLALLAERWDKLKHTAYFWSAIIVVRSAATNLGDIGHDLHLPALRVMAVFTGLLALSILLWQLLRSPKPESGSLATEPAYWWTMLVAGALGTVIGDYCSWGLHLGNLKAALWLGLAVAALMAILRTRLGQLWPYWLTVVAIRSAGTAAGDFLAHKVFGLPLSTLVSGLVFIALLVLWRERGSEETPEVEAA